MWNIRRTKSNGLCYILGWKVKINFGKQDRLEAERNGESDGSENVLSCVKYIIYCWM
jgi:hypothetical protein